MLSRSNRPVLTVFVLLVHAAPVLHAAPWIAADWDGREPAFPPGSLYWHTDRFRASPIVYRVVLEILEQPLDFAGLAVRARGYVYLFLDGQKIAAHVEEGDQPFARPLELELTHLLEPGRRVLLVSARSDGFSLDGSLGYADGTVERFGSSARGWKVTKLEPLARIEAQPFNRADFDDTGWFGVQVTEDPVVRLTTDAVKALCGRFAAERLGRLDEDGRWRLAMLAEKGIAIVDWEARGWGGAGRIPGWVRELARAEGKAGTTPGSTHWRAEALTQFVVLNDEAANLENQAVGLAALDAPEADREAAIQSARAVRGALAVMEELLRAGRFREALPHAGRAQVASGDFRATRVVNRLNGCLDNRFSWFDTTRLLDSDPARWGLELRSPAEAHSSPLSPAARVRLATKELVLAGWEDLEPGRTYKHPPRTGPVCLWAVLGEQVRSLQPEEGGVVYDRSVDGPLGENWVLLNEDLERGGRLPVQLVFLRAPTNIVFESGERGTRSVTLTFQEPGAELFILRPLKEWRGYLAQARTLTASPIDGRAAAPHVEACRLWSRALLHYPVAFSETFVRESGEPPALRVADVYDYLEFEDEWGTEPLRLAPLPPLATYGLMVGFPGLETAGAARVLGSRGIWGDEVAVVGKDHIVYRVPLDPIRRFGGFTSYCFGPTDIGGPGSRKEIETIRSTGANTFRPQHNQTGERAMRTVRWCIEEGIQHVFNIDEKWIPDAVEHFRALAQKCKAFPPDAVAYDVLNEPETRDPRAYAALVTKITRAIREIDPLHLIYIETIPPWGPGAKPFPQAAFERLEPTGDPRTVYSFHDYEFRLPRRWPNDEHDARDLLDRWIPAFRFAIDHRAPIHLGEFGGFEQTKEDVYENRCAITLMMDYLSIFDQFGWHWHYYANRGVTRVREDGSLEESHVQAAYRRYFRRGTFNVNRPEGSG